MNEDQTIAWCCIAEGDLDLEWRSGTPEVHFWPGKPLEHLVKRISLRELLLHDLRTNVPLEFYGDPLAFDPPKGWVHAERAQLLQALIHTYDKWEKAAT